MKTTEQVNEWVSVSQLADVTDWLGTHNWLLVRHEHTFLPELKGGTWQDTLICLSPLGRYMRLNFIAGDFDDIKVYN